MIIVGQKDLNSDLRGLKDRGFIDWQSKCHSLLSWLRGRLSTGEAVCSQNTAGKHTEHWLQCATLLSYEYMCVKVWEDGGGWGAGITEEAIGLWPPHTLPPSRTALFGLIGVSCGQPASHMLQSLSHAIQTHIFVFEGYGYLSEGLQR